MAPRAEGLDGVPLSWPCPALPGGGRPIRGPEHRMVLDRTESSVPRTAAGGPMTALSVSAFHPAVSSLCLAGRDSGPHKRASKTEISIKKSAIY